MAWKSPLMPSSVSAEIVIVGGGPAGIAAAIAAEESGVRTLVLDDNASPGGQIWRAGLKHQPAAAIQWIKRLEATGTTVVPGARVTHSPRAGCLVAETNDTSVEVKYRKLILATGARELFLPFPGWTLPNVIGAGGLQALVKSGLPIPARAVLVPASGPLLLAVASYLRQNGASVAIAEQAPLSSVLRFSLELKLAPSKIMQAISLRARLLGAPYLTSCWPVAAYGDDRLSHVFLRRGKRTWRVDCDYLACGYHLVPNVELPLLLGCEAQVNGVLVNDYQETSVSGIYCAGEPTGIGGVELALVEGQIAGFAAAGKHQSAQALFDAR